MLRLPRPNPKPRGEGTIALINIVFLMLIFFLVAGALAPPMDNAVRLIGTRDAQPAQPPDALAAHADGSLHYRGAATTPEAHLAALAARGPGVPVAVKLAADRNLPAAKLIDIVLSLKSAGAGSVTVVTERAAP